MAAAEDEIGKLKALVFRALESNGVLGGIRAQIRSNVYRAIEKDEIAVNQSENAEVPLALDIVLNFLHASGYVHAADTLVHEAGVSRSNLRGPDEIVGALGFPFPSSALKKSSEDSISPSRRGGKDSSVLQNLLDYYNSSRGGTFSSSSAGTATGGQDKKSFGARKLAEKTGTSEDASSGDEVGVNTSGSAGSPRDGLAATKTAKHSNGNSAKAANGTNSFLGEDDIVAGQNSTGGDDVAGGQNTGDIGSSAIINTGLAAAAGSTRSDAGSSRPAPTLHPWLSGLSSGTGGGKSSKEAAEDGGGEAAGKLSSLADLPQLSGGSAGRFLGGSDQISPSGETAGEQQGNNSSTAGGGTASFLLGEKREMLFSSASGKRPEEGTKKEADMIEEDVVLSEVEESISAHEYSDDYEEDFMAESGVNHTTGASTISIAVKSSVDFSVDSQELEKYDHFEEIRG